MQRYLTAVTLGLACLAAATLHPAFAQAPEVTVTRLECGARPPPSDPNPRFTTTLVGLKLQTVYSCYLIKHGNDYMMWDTGQALDAPLKPGSSNVEQLARLKVAPEQVKFVGISHWHQDHIGQANSFTKATLLIGSGDWEILTSPTAPPNAKKQYVSHWITGGGKVETVPEDKDVFGDGTVVMLATPGHTPGHHCLMVKQSNGKTVILSGDMAHFHENYNTNGVPGFNFDKAKSIASMERIRKIAADMKAELIIQHDYRDADKLPNAPK